MICEKINLSRNDQTNSNAPPAALPSSHNSDHKSFNSKLGESVGRNRKITLGLSDVDPIGKTAPAGSFPVMSPKTRALSGHMKGKSSSSDNNTNSMSPNTSNIIMVTAYNGVLTSKSGPRKYSYHKNYSDNNYKGSSSPYDRPNPHRGVRETFKGGAFNSNKDSNGPPGPNGGSMSNNPLANILGNPANIANSLCRDFRGGGNNFKGSSTAAIAKNLQSLLLAAADAAGGDEPRPSFPMPHSYSGGGGGFPIR